MFLSATNHIFPYCDNGYARNCSFPQSHCVPRSPIKLPDSFYKGYKQDFKISARYKFNDHVVIWQDIYSARKKKVSFADDKGLKLVEVREIPGPPKWADDVITLLIGSSKRSVVKEKKWRKAFDHPPWSDEMLMHAVENNMLALEHVSIHEGTDDYLYGAVKVKNLTFKKDVFLRVTFDRWLSHIDIPCTYINSTKTGSKANKYDTFSFDFKISPVASRFEVIEFCICFQCDGQEFWENNGGINFRLVAEYCKSSASDSYKTKMFTQSNSDSVKMRDY